MTMDIINIPAQAVEGRPGTTDTAVLVQMPDGQVVPVGVQVGKIAADYLDVYNTDGARVIGVRQHGVTIDFKARQEEAKRKAVALVYLCQTSSIYRDEARTEPDLVMAERVMETSKFLARHIYQQVDNLIAAYEGAARQFDVRGQESSGLG